MVNVPFSINTVIYPVDNILSSAVELILPEGGGSLNEHKVVKS